MAQERRETGMPNFQVGDKVVIECTDAFTDFEMIRAIWSCGQLQWMRKSLPKDVVKEVDDFIGSQIRETERRVCFDEAAEFKTQCLHLIGTVESMTPTGGVNVSFLERENKNVIPKDIQCTMEPHRLVKMGKFLPGDLVKVVDDIHNYQTWDTVKCNFREILVLMCEVGFQTMERLVSDFLRSTIREAEKRDCCTQAPEHMRNILPRDLVNAVDVFLGSKIRETDGRDCCKKATEVRGCFGIVLSTNSDSADEIAVAVDGVRKSVSRIHLDFVGRAVYGDYNAERTRRLFPDPSDVSRHPDVVDQIMDDLKYWLPDRSEDQNDYDVLVKWLPKKEVKRLLRFGLVAEEITDDDYIVEFGDGCRWYFRTTFLQEASFLPEWRPGVDGVLSNYFMRCARFLEEPLPAEAVFAACYGGYEEFLRKNGADGDLRDANGNTPLHYAVHGNQPDIIELLLALGGEINAVNKHNETSLHIAVKKGFVDCVRQLKRRRLDLGIQDDQGNTALHLAISESKNDIIDLLVDHPEVKFEIPNKHGLPALHLAAVNENAMAVQKILSERKDIINDQDSGEGDTALHLAALRGHYDVAKVLLSQECCEVDITNKHGETPLVAAASNGHWRMVELLFLAGADINSADRHGNTALHMSLRTMEKQMVEHVDMPESRALKAAEKTIVDHGYTGDTNRLAIPCLLVRRGAKIDCINKEGITPLNIASTLEKPVDNLLEFFIPQKWNADSEKCLNCFETPANTKFLPCGDRVCCDKCAEHMKFCFNCTMVIITMETTDTSTMTTITTEKYSVIAGERPATKEYSMTRKPRGMCIIINNMDFDIDGNQHTRKGSEIDAQRMKSLFTQLHFRVTLRTNLKALDMERIFADDAKSEEHWNADCLVVILLSHGLYDVIYGTDYEPVDLRRDIYPLFNNENCPALMGKPKLFFVQTCRGADVQVCRAVQRNDETDNALLPQAPVAAQKMAMPEWSDMYIAYSTIPHYASLRDTQNGTWFISTVFSVFRQHAATAHLEALMRMVAEDMMRIQDRKGRMQTPNIDTYGWTKLLYFNPMH
ncbi:uncharacterized protein LOC144147085 isoform X3 [Haemaphysalis longicornis]